MDGKSGEEKDGLR